MRWHDSNLTPEDENGKHYVDKQRKMEQNIKGWRKCNFMVLLHSFTNYPYFSRKISILLFFIFFLGGILEIWLVNRLSTYGEEIQKIAKAIEVLKLENQVLKNQIDSRSSLKEIEVEAKKLGFQAVINTKYLH